MIQALIAQQQKRPSSSQPQAPGCFPNRRRHSRHISLHSPHNNGSDQRHLGKNHDFNREQQLHVSQRADPGEKDVKQ